MAAIAEITGEKPRYLGIPSLAFEIGRYSVSKEGMLWGSDCNELIQQLIERGFQAE